MKEISAESFLEIKEKVTLFDIRSPSEYAKGRISGAISLPLFSDEERAEIGTIYKKSGKDNAVLRGLDLVGPKLASFVKQTLKYKGPLYIYCWRGGMRSRSMAWLLETSGRNVTLITGGYKSYRSALNDVASRAQEIIVLGGTTGSGKTDILKQMESLGEQVIDLEGLANHKGSSFGALGQNTQPTTEQFQNLVLEKMCSLDFSRTIWVESESKTIGKVFIPDVLHLKMLKSLLVKVQVPKSCRVKRLVAEYAMFSKKELEDGVLRVQKRIGGKDTSTAIEAIYKGDFALTADIILDYYDKSYEFAFNKRESEIKVIEVSEDNPINTANKVLEFIANSK